MKEEEGYIYICGDVSVGTSVKEALVKLAMEMGKLSTFGANVRAFSVIDFFALISLSVLLLIWCFFSVLDKETIR